MKYVLKEKEKPEPRTIKFTQSEWELITSISDRTALKPKDLLLCALIALEGK